MIWMLLHTQPTEKEIIQTEYRNIYIIVRKINFNIQIKELIVNVIFP